MRFRLALATKPHDVFFLCQVPSRNLDNSWNGTTSAGCEQAKTRWTQVTSRKEEGVEGYKIDYAPRPGRVPRAEMADAVAQRTDRPDLRGPHD